MFVLAWRIRAPDRSREVFATAGKPVYEAKPIATPTIKYEIGPLLKDEMAQPNKGRLTYAMPSIYTNREHTRPDVEPKFTGRPSRAQVPDP